MGGEPVCEAAVAPRHCAPYALRAPSARLDWAELLKRTHDIDALACPCGGRLQFIALILDSGTAKEILDAMGLWSEAPPLARAVARSRRPPGPSDAGASGSSGKKGGDNGGCGCRFPARSSTSDGAFIVALSLLGVAARRRLLTMPAKKR